MLSITRLTALALATALFVSAQSPSAIPEPTPAPTAPIAFQVHYLGPDTVVAKYGRKLPKTVFAGSVTGVNNGTSNVTFGQGYVLQVLRSNGYRALSQQDARAVVLKAQARGIQAIWNKYSPVGVKILDDIQGLQVLRVVTFSTPIAAALTTADALAKVIQPDVNGILAQIYQDYDADGIQNLMQLPPGGSLAGTLLFEAEGAKPNTTAAQVFTIQVPIAK